MIVFELYQDVILEHNKNPKNFYRMKNATNYSKGINPLCGDNIEIFCYVKNSKIQNISFYGRGCAISKASASIMINIVNGKEINEVLKFFEIFKKFLTSKSNDLYNVRKAKDLLIFENIKKTPMRIKCAMLSWYALKGALINSKTP